MNSAVALNAEFRCCGYFHHTYSFLRQERDQKIFARQWCQNRGFAATDPTTTPRPSVPPPSACTAPHKHSHPSIRVPYALPGQRSPARIRFPDIEALGLQAKSQEFKSRCGYSTFFLYLFSNFSSYILRRLKTRKLLIYKIFSKLQLVIKDAVQASEGERIFNNKL